MGRRGVALVKARKKAPGLFSVYSNAMKINLVPLFDLLNVSGVMKNGLYFALEDLID
jgi:hypothetical protein